MMEEVEKLARAEEFVRKALQLLNSNASEEQIMEAAKKAAKCLPPFRKRERR